MVGQPITGAPVGWRAIVVNTVQIDRMFLLARQSARFFRLLDGLKTKHQIEFDEVLVFFALGRLNFDDSQNLMFVKPTNIVSLAAFLGMPPETLRRKLAKLEERDLVLRSNYGFVVKNMPTWQRIAEAIAPEAAEARAAT